MAANSAAASGSLGGLRPQNVPAVPLAALLLAAGRASLVADAGRASLVADPVFALVVFSLVLLVGFPY